MGEISQRSVAIDVADLYAINPCKRLQGPQLVERHVIELVRLHIHLTAAKALQIGIADMRSNLNALFRTHPDAFIHNHRVSAMEPACQVGRGNNIQNGRRIP